MLHQHAQRVSVGRRGNEGGESLAEQARRIVHIAGAQRGQAPARQQEREQKRDPKNESRALTL